MSFIDVHIRGKNNWLLRKVKANNVIMITEIEPGDHGYSKGLRSVIDINNDLMSGFPVKEHPNEIAKAIKEAEK